MYNRVASYVDYFSTIAIEVDAVYHCFSSQAAIALSKKAPHRVIGQTTILDLMARASGPTVGIRGSCRQCVLLKVNSQKRRGSYQNQGA
jgi:hypothetical protein